VALGAQPADVIGHILKPALWQVVVGSLVGAAAGAAAARALRSFLFGVAPSDVVTWVVVFVLVAGMVGVASYLPARRAAGIDPSTLLRRE
jgi:ABC-type antimicrobial peptide transport system permease subunit